MDKDGDITNPIREKISHPSKNLPVRKKGYGVAAGYEKPYKKDQSRAIDRDTEVYGPIPHAGYFGAGLGLRPFKSGQASFKEEIDWYQTQYGESTSGFERVKKKK